MARQANPRLQSPQMFSRQSRNKSSAEFLKELEELNKLNRGGFSSFADDTGAEAGFIVPGGTPIRNDYIPQVAGQTGFANVARPTYPDIPETEQQPITDVGATSDPMDLSSAEGFFSGVAQSLYSPQQTSQEGFDGAYPIASMDDGSIRWSDGSIRPAQSMEAPQPVQQLADGNVLWSDGYVRQGIPDYAINALSGESALSRGLFGTDQTVTQPFGNYNPIEPTPGNINVGTDFRTRDLQTREIRNLFNSPLQVVESYGQAQPRSGYVGNMENQGYGNSLLLRLPNGSMIRVSHLDSNQYQAGDVIQPGDIIGIPGATGNVTGEHADVEVYSPEGQIISPQDFLAEVRQMSETSKEPLYKMENGRAVGPQSQAPQQALQTQSPVIQQLQQAKQSGGSLVESILNAPSGVTGQAVQIAQTPRAQAIARGAGQVLGSVVDKVQPTGEFDAGITEGAITPEAAQARLETVKQTQPSRGLLGMARQSLGNLTEAVGDYAGVPEGTLSELIAGSPTRRTNQAMASEINQAQGRQEGESLGLLEGTKNLAKDVGARVSNAFSGLFSNRNQSQDFTSGLDELQPGAGIDRLKRGMSKEQGLFSRALPEDLGQDRVVGQSAGQSLLPTSSSSPVGQGDGTKDVSDPFFNSPLFQKVQGFLSPDFERTRNQALSTDQFSDEFYQDPRQFGQVFGGTSQEGDAQAKYDAYQEEQRKKAEQNKPKPTLDDYLRMGKTAAQWYAETGQQSTLDSIRANPRMSFDDRSGSISRVGDAPRSQSQDRVIEAGRSAVDLLRSNPITGQPTPYSIVNDSSGQSQVVRQGETPVKTPSAQIKPGTDTSKGLFNRGMNAAKGIFKRFFN